MKNEFAQTRFTIEITEDGSPTLRLPEDGESMHHSGGAAAETDYIYKSVIEAALSKLPDLKMAVVGLGLGYIEISWATAVLNLNGNGSSEFESFEIDPELRAQFLSWLENDRPDIYQQICHFLAPRVPVEKIKQLLKKNLQEHPLKGDLISDYPKNNTYNLICFDAFSRKTSENLWTEEFLEEFFKTACHPDCIVTTYACTGNLKRALKKNGFQLIERVSFKGKRDSTLAVRGIFTSGTTFRIS